MRGRHLNLNEIEIAFLNLLCGSLKGKDAEKSFDMQPECWKKLLGLADEQEVLPLIYDMVCHCPSFRALKHEQIIKYRKRALDTAIEQIVQNNEFLTMMLHAEVQGLSPIVIKGCTVRRLYPRPMLRPSVDEDLLIEENYTEEYHQFFLSEGLFADSLQLIDEDDIYSVLSTSPEERNEADELSYHKPNSPIYIELHKHLFPPSSDAYGDLNELFHDAADRAVTIQIEDVEIRSLHPTDHLLYLICHAYKHFLHGGFGIRQVCDICLFAEKVSLHENLNADKDNEVIVSTVTQDISPLADWDEIYSKCKLAHIEKFAAAVFRIGSEYLGFDMPAVFSKIIIDVEPLLKDILSDGTYGTNDINRAHSANMTLDAIVAGKTGKKSKGIIRSVFLPLDSMQRRYDYLRKYPFLLPIAWTERICQYLSGGGNEERVQPSMSIKIGNERIALLKKYGIID